MRSADALSCLGMEVFVKQEQIPPVRHVGVAFGRAKTGSVALLVGKKERDEAVAKVNCNVAKIREGAGAARILDGERFTVKIEVALERFNDQEVDWKPDRSPPV